MDSNQAMQQKSTIKSKGEKTGSVNATSIGWRLLLYLVPIILFTYLSFTPSLKNSFINWDDNGYVFENKQLDKPLSESIPFFFGQHYFIGNYIPVTMSVYALVYKVAGMDPPSFHVVNLLLHLLNVALVFLFIYLLSGKKPLVAAIVALFFGVHPMHVESVAWVAELKDVLYTGFFLAGLIVYHKYITLSKTAADTPAGFPKLLLLAFAFFLLSVLSKPAALTFPVVLLLLDFYTGRKFDKSVWIEKLPFFVLSVIFGVIAIKAQQADKLIHDYYPFTQRLLFAAHSLLEYMAKLFLPVHLSNFYPYPSLTDGHLPFIYYISPVIVIGLFYGAYRTMKYSRLIVFGLLFFVVNLLLVLQLLSIGDAVIADRYTYVPYIGLFFIIAMGFDWLYNNARQSLSAYKSVAAGLLIVCAVSCSYLTYARCPVWENDDTIASDLLEKYPDDRLALNNKGFVMYAIGRYEESIPFFEKAIAVKPDYVMAYINLANSYIALKNYDKAYKVAEVALTHAPQDFHLLNTKAYVLFMQHKYAESISTYNSAISIEKKNDKAYIYLLQVYYEMKDLDNAMKTADAGLKYFPDDYILLNSKGYLLFLKGNYTDAMHYYNASLKMKPDYGVAQANLAACIKVMNEPAKAVN